MAKPLKQRNLQRNSKMKNIQKLCTILLFLLCGLLMGACTSKAKIEKKIDNVSYANIKLNITDPLYVGDSHDIENYLTFSSNMESVVFQCMSTDEKVLSFDGKTFLCNSVGKTTIRVRVKVKDGTYVIANQNVEVESTPSYYTSFSFEKDVVYANYSDKTAKNSILAGGKSSFPVIIDITNNLVTYDINTGEIKFNGIGDCVVIARVPYGRDVNKNMLYHEYSFKVYVDKYISSLSIKGGSSTITLKEGEENDFILNTNDYSCADPILSVDSDVVTISGKHYVANRSGECTLTISYLTNPGVTKTKTYKLKVITEPSALTGTLYLSGTEVVGDLKPNTEYVLILSSTGIKLNKDYVSISGIECKIGTNLDNVKITFTTPSSLQELKIRVTYNKETYSDTVNFSKEFTFVVA